MAAIRQLHSSNYEPHNEEHPHSEKLIVDYELNYDANFIPDMVTCQISLHATEIWFRCASLGDDGMFVVFHSFESSGDQEAVADAISADVHQETITVDGLVKPVNGIAQAVPVTAPDDEMSVPMAAVVAAGVMTTSNVAGANGVAKALRRQCGTRSCSLPDFHAGLCTSAFIDPFPSVSTGTTV